MREGWNFHNDIALGLETDARGFFGDATRPLGKIYDADRIEASTFAEVMIILLRARTDYSCDNTRIGQFIERCAKYVGKSGNDITMETAQTLYEEFKQLFE